MKGDLALKCIDADFTQLKEADFVRVVYEPKTAEQLDVAVAYLIENWPTSEAISAFKKHMLDIKGGIRGDESATLKDMDTAHILKFISTYQAGNQDLQDKAKLFMELFRCRPVNSHLKDFYGTSEELGSVAQAAYRIRRHY